MITLKKKNNLALCFLLVSVVLFTCSMTAWAQTYTLDADFDLGTLVNVNHDAPDNDQLQLNWVTEPFPFVNIACSSRGTIVRIDVNTGQILGEYWSSHQTAVVAIPHAQQWTSTVMSGLATVMSPMVAKAQ